MWVTMLTHQLFMYTGMLFLWLEEIYRIRTEETDLYKVEEML